MQKKINWILLKFPEDDPPRASLGYSLVQQIHILHYYKLISPKLLKDLQAAVKLLKQKQEEIKAEAGFLADNVGDKIPVIYINCEYESVAIRLKQQLNENAKMLCWYNVLPEMNHNEIVGWRGDYENVAVIMLRNQNDQARVAQRFDFCMATIANCTSAIFEIYSQGKTKMEQALFLIHLGDWLSFYASKVRGYDATEVRVIDQLKNDLESLKW